jgi:hypothetical protein
MNLDQIYDKLKARKRFLGMTYRDIDQESGYNWSLIHKWFQRRRNLKLKQFLDLLQTLGLKMTLELDQDDKEEGD